MNTYYLGLALMGISVYMAVYTVMREEQGRQSDEALSRYDDMEGEKDATSSMFLRYTRPFYTRYILPSVEKSSRFDDRRKILKKKLLNAGISKLMTPDEMISFKFALIFAYPLLLFLIAWLLEDTFPVLAYLMVGAFGWFYPDKLWLAGIIKNRQLEIKRALPFVVDLLALSIEAGLDFMGGLARVVEKSKRSPLIDELEQIQKEVQLGSSRKEALKAFAARVDMTEIASFVAIIVAAEETGGSIGKVLRQQSEEIRTDRMMRAETEGAKATQKVMLPLFLFFFPAILLLIGIPVALQFF